MVSTRQMTGNTTDEANLNVYRLISSPTSSALYSSSHVSSSNIETSFTIQRSKQDINLMDLPTELLEKIFSFVEFKRIAQLREVSYKMNQVCSSILNSTFQKLQNQMHSRFQTVKAKMPRRESARRNHPLACECDILETCYMRLSLLQMTFGKHIERKHCCFFPGAIIDEVYSVLGYIRTSPSLDRPFKVTDELFDLSTMAMEYFKEHIEPNLPDIGYFTNSSKSFASLEASSTILSRDTSHTSSSSPPQSNMVLRKGIRKIKQGMKRYNNQLTVLRNELRTCRRKATEQTKTITEQQKLLAEQQKQTLELANRLDDTDNKSEELSRKFSTVLQELNKCKTELQYWRSNYPTITTSKADDLLVAPVQINAFDTSGAVITTLPNNIKDAEKHIDQQKSLRLHPTQTKATQIVNDNLELSAHSAFVLKPEQKRKRESRSIAYSMLQNDSTVDDNSKIQIVNTPSSNPLFASASVGAPKASPSFDKSNFSSGHQVSSLDQSDQLIISKSNETQRQSHKESDVLVFHNLKAEYVISGCDGIGNTVKNHNLVTAKPTIESLATAEKIQNTVSVLINENNTNNVKGSSSCYTSTKHSSTNKNRCGVSNDMYHETKKRKVQNKARSQVHKNISYNYLTNKDLKNTRSKQIEK